jgi:hypothetical protein
LVRRIVPAARPSASMPRPPSATPRTRTPGACEPFSATLVGDQLTTEVADHRPGQARGGAGHDPAAHGEEAGTLTFEVTDDGAGSGAAGGGLGAGLLNMADRLAVFGGRLRVDSAPGRGTCVTGTVPVAAAATTAPPEVLAPLP